MRILKITRLMPEGPFFLFCGVVEGSSAVRTGDEVVLLDAAGTRETAIVSGVMVEDPTEGSRGARLLDVGTAGQSVRLMLRRPKTAKLDAAAVVAIEKPAAA